jgi:hypothetical protein
MAARMFTLSVVSTSSGSHAIQNYGVGLMLVSLLRQGISIRRLAGLSTVGRFRNESGI